MSDAASPRNAHRRSRLPPGLLLALLFLAAPWAGCLDAGPPGPSHADEAPEPHPSPRVEEVRPLPTLRLDAAMSGTRLTLRIHLDGDPSAVAAHSVDWGDGTVLSERPGAPPARYTHTYAPPPHWRADPAERDIKVTLFDPIGNTRNSDAHAVVPPPANDPPIVTLTSETAAESVPARLTFRLGAEDRDGTLRGWRFDPGDGSAPITDEGTPLATLGHAYTRIGTFDARLTVTDDGGAETTRSTRVHVLPPQDRALWSVSSSNGTVYQSDANGTLRATRTLYPPCYPERPCPRVVDAAANGAAFAVLLARDNRSELVVLDGDTGHIRDLVPLPPAATALFVAPDGRYWITHRDGTVTWTHGDTPPRSLQIATTGASIRLAFGTTTSWALVSDTTARLYQIDPVNGRSSPGSLPLPAPAHHLAVNHKHDQVVAVDDDGHAWIAAATPYGPRLVRMALLGDGGTPAGLACPGGHDRCWTALDGDTAQLVPLDVGPSATGLQAPAAITFPRGVHPTAVHATTRHVLVFTAGNGNHTHLVDPTNGGLVATVAPPTGKTPHRFDTHPQHPRIAYLGEGHRWTVLDMERSETVHSAAEPAGDLGPYLVTLPWTRTR